MGILSTFTVEPEGVTFENQEEGESIILVLRRDFITNVPWITTTLFLLIVPLLVPLLFSFSDFFFFVSLPDTYLTVFLGLYYLIVLGYAFLNFVSWFYNVGIVTNLRVIDVDIHNFMSKNVAATSIDGIVDVEYSQAGFLQNTFDFGNILMQTEGIKANFEFLSVPRPATVADIISDLISEGKHKK